MSPAVMVCQSTPSTKKLTQPSAVFCASLITYARPSADGRAYVISDAQKTADGCVNFFVDGVLWQTITAGDIDTAVQPAQVVAIEAYRSSATPSQFVPRDQN